jgi:hypothetical protein
MGGLGRFAIALALAGIASAQAMTEYGAAAAGGAVGAAAGKKVSDGITNIFGKVDQQTKAAAKKEPPKPEKPAATSTSTSDTSTSDRPTATANVSPSGPTGGSSTGPASPAPAPAPAPKPRPAAAPTASVSRTNKRAVVNVPDPPPAPGERITPRKPVAPPPPPVVEEAAPVVPPPPPPPVATAENLQAITTGETREEVLKLGLPAARITMFDDGHLLEIYSYSVQNKTFGVVRLSDGAVSRVELR